MDRAVPKGNNGLAGLSVRNGPVSDRDAVATNGSSKRKSRSSISNINYRDESGSEGEPLVSCTRKAAAQI